MSLLAGGGSGGSTCPAGYSGPSRQKPDSGTVLRRKRSKEHVFKSRFAQMTQLASTPVSSSVNGVKILRQPLQ